jgi:membrane-associated phospholipid phosphatase
VATWVFDFAPVLIVIVLAYGEVPTLVSALGSPYRDALVQRWEFALFGTQPAHTLAAHVPQLLISELLHAGYLSYYLALSLPGLALYARGNRTAFSNTALALVIPWVIGCAWYVFFPVQGPRYLWPAPPGVPDGPFRTLSLAILGAGSARGTAFPSLHMAVSLSAAIVAWRWQPRWVAVLLSVIAMLVAVGAVYAGYHYAIDMIAGALLGMTTSGLIWCWTSASPIRRGHNGCGGL